MHDDFAEWRDRLADIPRGRQDGTDRRGNALRSRGDRRHGGRFVRVRLEHRKEVLNLWHFRFVSKHIELLRQLQIEVPSLELVAFGPDGKRRVILVGDLNLDHKELRFLNPLLD